MMCLACLGLENYRTTAEQGHHRELLEAICERVRGGQGLLDRVQALMEARNRKYTGAGRTTQDAEDAVKVMNEFLTLAEAWINPKVERLGGDDLETDLGESRPTVTADQPDEPGSHMGWMASPRDAISLMA